MDTNYCDSPVQWLADEVNEFCLINPSLKPAFDKLVEHALKMQEVKTRIDYLNGFKNSQSPNINSFEL